MRAPLLRAIVAPGAAYVNRKDLCLCRATLTQRSREQKCLWCGQHGGCDGHGFVDVAEFDGICGNARTYGACAHLPGKAVVAPQREAISTAFSWETTRLGPRFAECENIPQG